MKPTPFPLLLLPPAAAAPPGDELLLPLLLSPGMTTAGLTVGGGASPVSCLVALLGRLTATAEAVVCCG